MVILGRDNVKSVSPKLYHLIDKVQVADISQMEVTGILQLFKGGFFWKVRFIFQISQSPKKIIPKKYPELEI